MVQWKKSEWNLQHIVHASHWAEPKCVCHRVYSQKRVHCTKEKDICWGIETDTNYHQLSPIITYYHQFVHQCHQYYGLILIGLTRQFQKYVYVGVSKQIPIFTNYHQLSPICSPILWFDNDRLNEVIPKIYICWGIEADTNFHQLSPIIINYYQFVHQLEHVSHGAEPKCVHHGVHGRKWVHSTIEKEQAELTTPSACVTRGRAKVLASRSSPSDKSSRLEKSSGK